MSVRFLASPAKEWSCVNARPLTAPVTYQVPSDPTSNFVGVKLADRGKDMAGVVIAVGAGGAAGGEASILWRSPSTVVIGAGAGGVAAVGSAGGVDGLVCAQACGDERASSPAAKLASLIERLVMVVRFLYGCVGRGLALGRPTPGRSEH